GKTCTVLDAWSCVQKFHSAHEKTLLGMQQGGNLRTSFRGSLDQTLTDSPNSSLGAVCDIDLAKNVLNVFFDRFDADAQRTTDFTVAETQGEVTKHLHFTIGQWKLTVLGIVTLGHGAFDARHDASVGLLATAGRVVDCFHDHFTRRAFEDIIDRIPKDPFFPLFLRIKLDYLDERRRISEEREKYILGKIKELPPVRRRIIRFLAEWEEELSR
ncbi:MAG: hypothetical protein PQJ50_10715, partial [Spirochaetales bacterium]|nr:hypothetical protein [Spirochaetales bacterium]